MYQYITPGERGEPGDNWRSNSRASHLQPTAYPLTRDCPIATTATRNTREKALHLFSPSAHDPSRARPLPHCNNISSAS